MLRSYVFIDTATESAEAQFNKFLANTNLAREQVISIQYIGAEANGSSSKKNKIFILVEEKR
ncbi:hypothetical protein Dtox_0896 [Desulfofarcimen acetoxidans DSM 771]|jgi:hypothetical protein|uniref:Uncharacterized protein n=1 Tax=Desulfofarcimen acetoxidans (strain ATCC 49208 / DSM 771 / KCTC 5769 / VKM B-1644 / 5575) TaxID=485916 RepID=C8W325_DESAS|nr:hypothetical protein [Desulfofarcimen acetoxidans]ACV61792.1 hypothetical protein Dtox_0896 [Desulfofarcimen acetoxidans DSM 771]